MEKKTEKKVKESSKVEELTNLLKRVQADFENYKKTVEKQRAESAVYYKQDLIKKLLPILDSMELSLKNTTYKEKFIKGIELIFSQFYSTLKSEGLKPIESVGKFDPYMHEVLLKENSDKDEDTILEELQKGYMLNDRVIRHTKVKVAKHVIKKDTTKKSA